MFDRGCRPHEGVPAFLQQKLTAHKGSAMKISIIGIGRVGSAIAFSIVQQGVADELVLVNRTPRIAAGEALDLLHANAFTAKPINIRAGSLADTADSQIVIYTASVPMPANFKSRNEIAIGNDALLNEQVPAIAKYSPDAILLMVTNPVDAMTYVALQASGFPASRVIGTGTLIDSARFRTLLSREFRIHPDDIRAYILGEHGECQFPALSVAMIGGVSIQDSETALRLFDDTVRGGFDVAHSKGYTNYAIAMATLLIVKSIADDWRRTMPVSTLIEGYCDVHDVCLSIPAVIGRHGIERHLLPPLSAEEQQAFQTAATAVKKTIAECTG
jgi:L-lactate dehydrogenase